MQWHRGAGVPGSTQPVYHARWATTDARGHFALPSAIAPSPRMWFLRTYPPSYSVFHPDYGLQHARAREGPLRIELSSEIAESALRDVAPYCRGEHDDAGSRRIAEVACCACCELWSKSVR